tara:strand:+ start:282 stop:593 length:312 start_codon:yes stop_codon:yes gene_type:complete
VQLQQQEAKANFLQSELSQKNKEYIDILEIDQKNENLADLNTSLKQTNKLILKMKREDFFLQEQKILMENHNSEFYRSKMSDFNLTILANTSQLGSGNTSPPL